MLLFYAIYFFVVKGFHSKLNLRMLVTTPCSYGCGLAQKKKKKKKNAIIFFFYITFFSPMIPFVIRVILLFFFILHYLRIAVLCGLLCFDLYLADCLVDDEEKKKKKKEINFFSSFLFFLNIFFSSRL